MLARELKLNKMSERPLTELRGEPHLQEVNMSGMMILRGFFLMKTLITCSTSTDVA